MKKARVQLEPGWKTQLLSQFDEPYMVELRAWLLARAAAGVEIYPPSKQWFSAFNMTPFSDVKIVILGQDPYHGPGQAHGLCFSVQSGVRVPPSLVNIYKELRADLGIEPVSHGNLESWARQGVFLLNSVLTVERGQAAAHQNKGWEQFTDVVIDKLANNTDNTVFLLWGGYARKKGRMIDSNRHLVLECAHPSPLSVRGFTGCRHFSKANTYLEKHGKTPVDWRLPEALAVC